MLAKNTNATVLIAMITGVVFLLQLFLGDWFTNLFVLYSDSFISQPWTLVTSMFLHGSLGHIFFNMYALLLFGPLVESRIGFRRFLQIYFLSGILAGIGYSLFQELIIGQTAAALGASGAVMGIIGMTIILFPNLQLLLFFVLPVSMRVAGIIFVMIDVFGLFADNGVANMAHLVGLAVGLVYARQLVKKGRQFRQRFTQARVRPTHKTGQTSTHHMDDNEIEDYLKHGKL